MFDRDAARNIKMKQFGVQVRPVSEFISCGLPTKGAIVREPSRAGKLLGCAHDQQHWYLSKSATRAG